MKSALRAGEARAKTSHFKTPSEVVNATPAAVPLDGAIQAGRKIAAGEFVTMVEIVPPKGIDVRKEVDGAKYLKSVGMDAINIPDSPRASARMGNQALCNLIEREVRHRDCAALHLPRPECAEHSERSAGASALGIAQPDLHHGRSAEAGKLSGCHGGVRRGRDRTGQHRSQSEPGRGDWREPIGDRRLRL